MTHVLLIDGQRCVADALRLVLVDAYPDLVVTIRHSCRSALNAVVAGHHVDLVLLDLAVSDVDGLGPIDALRRRGVHAPVIAIGTHEELRPLRAIVLERASGFVAKTFPGPELVAAVGVALSGGRTFPSSMIALEPDEGRAPGGRRTRGVASPNDSSPQPTRRQLEVLRLLADGQSNRQISARVRLSEATVKYHVTGLFRLFGVDNRTRCIRMARREGVL